MKIKSPFRFSVFLIAVIVVVTGMYCAIDYAASFLGFQWGFFGKADAFMQRGSVNVLIGGVDEDGTRTDLLMVAQYSFKAGTCNILQVPRDLKVETARWDKKINSAYGWNNGSEVLKQEIKQALGLEIDKYVIVSFKGFRDIIDAIGGVEVDVPMRMSYHDPYQGGPGGYVIDLQKGPQLLDGRKAEMFMRFRQNDNGTGYAEGDVGRIRAQRQFYDALMDKVVSARGVLQVPKLVGIVQQSVKTDFGADEILRYIGIGLRMDKEKVNIMQLPGEGRFEGGVSYFFPYKEDMANMLEEYFNPKNAVAAAKKAEDVKINRSKNAKIKVEIINATGVSVDRLDIGEVAADLLRDNAFEVHTITVTEEKAAQTRLVDHNNKQASKEILKVLPGIPADKDKDKSSGCDVTLVLGMDFNM